jgi:PAS domain S-box-containing protein
MVTFVKAFDPASIDRRVRTVRLLIVEDDPAIALLLKELLSIGYTTRFQVEYVTSLGDALDRLSQSGQVISPSGSGPLGSVDVGGGVDVDMVLEDPIDAILLDLRLSDSSGLETVIAIRDASPDVPIIVLTALASDELAIDALQAGAQDYLDKGSLDSDLLVRSIRYAVERKRADIEIARQKQAEEALKGSRDFYLTMLEDFPVPVWRSDADGRCNYVNRTWAAFTGRTFEQELGDGWLESIHPDDRAHALEAYRSASDDQRPFATEYRLHRYDGEYRYVYDYGLPYYDTQGDFAGYHGLCCDITEQKRTEAALRRSEERFSKAFNASPAAIAITGLKDERVIDVNDVFVKMSGYSREEIVGKRSTDFGIWADPAERTRVMEIARQKGFVRGIETSFRTKSGEVLAASYSAEPIEIAGEPCLLSLVLDITPLKRINDELEMSLSILQSTLESTADGIAVVDNDDKMVSFNRKFTEMWRIPEHLMATRDAEQMRSFVVDQLQDPAAYLARVKELYWHDGESCDLLYFKDGRIFERYSKPHSIHGKRTGRVWSFRDVTERIHGENKLRKYASSQTQLLKLLLQAQEAERRRLSMELHDGPLQSLGVSLMALDRATRRYKLDQHDIAIDEIGNVRDYLEETVKEVRAVLADLSLDQLRTYGLVAALEGHVARFSEVTGLRVEIRNNIRQRLASEIELLLYRLAQEALSNVRKHAQASKVTIRLGIRNEQGADSLNANDSIPDDGTQSPGRLFLTISDNGVGFNPQEALLKHEDGKALGLRSMRQRIQAVGGDLLIASDPAKGTTLEFWCPLPQVQDTMFLETGVISSTEPAQAS